MNTVDLSPLLQLLLLGLALGSLPLGYWLLRGRGQAPRQRLRALLLVTLFLTFDLVVFGAFTRLSDSGLGCPDWPGCFGEASPLGAHSEIAEQQALRPQGPVTRGKAWVEMVHRYWASAVGFLIVVAAALSWRWRAQLPAGAPLWASFTLLWVLLQGAFGALTVTMKLFPAIVTLHLLFGLGLLVLLMRQAHALGDMQPLDGPGLRPLALACALALGLQIALGGWVSTNYAVLVCSDFPTCQGQWWPKMDFAQGFALWRELGQTHGGDWLGFPALTAIHVTHRLGALVLTGLLLGLVIRLWAQAPRLARTLLALLALQVLTGVSNVVLGWPLVAALLHSAGAAGLVLVLTALYGRLRPTPQPETSFNKQVMA
ncbi:cytochrome c oxidase assembly protein subunit 15 [Inhella inkyongensis]|uniref:Cytochrome c oxidase assembly protein subunit 15 n=1 Tax=Inhella inkyongensis TaxID=392593 RepID=A0A840S0C1_9BURK|nr:COX15/CtaA family protein [Inhella inkyongensis]MBB5204517.1 cytochrome c oxidase assembly protein subunit 15 [Inhella inkyongensis]